MLRIRRTKDDIVVLDELDKLGVTPSQLEDFDFTDTAVLKPWGYEYLVYERDDKAICAWVLHLNKKGTGTSYHCHRTKKTRIVVLKGEISLRTIHQEWRLRERDEMLIDRAVFHSLGPLTDDCIVTEVESPSNKPDAVRWKDNWGRDRLEYESLCRLVKTDQIACPYKTLHDYSEDITRLAKETTYIFDSDRPFS